LSIVDIHELSYSIDNITILENISLQVQKGDYLAVVGPNGGGKSTLVNTILGLNRGYKGSIKLFGDPLKEFKRWEKIGFVPQRVIEIDSKFPITVHETVKLGRISSLRQFWRSHKEENVFIDEVMEMLKIPHLKDRLIGELSGGQKQRVMIARALVSKPELLILDEPNTGVDQETQREFYSFLKRLNREKGITIVFITHDIGVIEDSINSIVTVNRELIKSNNPTTIFNCKVMRDVYGIDSHLQNHRH
jgi:zinc transport system ATP-binding protein